jgi:iron(III) transport system substrate-binding protein
MARAAAPAEAGTVAAVAQYEGQDRAQKLLAGAKREGELTLYTSLTVEDMAVINGAFEKKYGIKVRMWRAGADKVLQRAVQEARGNRFDVDILEASTPSLESLRREKLLAPVKSPYHADLMAEAVPSHREWVGSRLNVFVHAYNINVIRKGEAPRSYQDLLQPKWKGKLGIEAADEDWFANVVAALGEENGLKLFREIGATNGFSVRKGHTLLTNLVASGEVPFALTVYNFTAEQVKQKGAPLEWYVMQPVVARANGLALARHAPHPHAAMLYYDFMISEEGQQILAKRDFVPTSKRVETPFTHMPMKLVDPERMLDEGEKWERLYADIVVKRAK